MTKPLYQALSGRNRQLQSFAAWGSWHAKVPDGMVCVAARVNGRDDRNGKDRHFLVPESEYDTRGIVFVVDPGRHAEIFDF